jgi:hypothetical protein
MQVNWRTRFIDFVNGGTKTLSSAVKQYEEKMFERFGKMSAADLKLFFEEDSAKGFKLADKFKARLPPTSLK